MICHKKEDLGPLFFFTYFFYQITSKLKSLPDTKLTKDRMQNIIRRNSPSDAGKVVKSVADVDGQQIASKPLLHAALNIM